MKKSVLFVLALLVLGAAGLAQAQDKPEILTFDSGVQINLPAGTVLDDSGAIPTVTLDRSVVVEIIDPQVMGQSPDTTRNMTLLDVLDLLLGAIGHEDSNSEKNSISLKLADRRDALAYDFVNNADAYQTVLVIRLSDDRVGAFNIRSLRSLTDAQRNMILAMALSFDVGEPAAPDPVAVLTAGLTKNYAYDSGVSFRYPKEYIIINTDDPPVGIGVENEIFITMVDPTQVGMPAGEPMESIVDFAIRGTRLTPDDFETLDVGGREALIGSTKEGSLQRSMVLVRFSDQTMGIMDIMSPAALTTAQLLQIRGIAASFDSASAEYTGRITEDVAASRDLFEEADAARKAKTYDEAIDLYTQAIALDDSFALAYYWRAATYLDTGDLENALADFQQALALEPGEPQIHKDIAEVHALLDDLDASVAEFEAMIAEVGQNGLSDEIRASYELVKAVAEGGFSRQFYFARADRLRLMKRFDEALRDNQTLRENIPDDARLFAQLGVIYMDMERPNDAVRAFTQGIALEPLPILFYNRGYANRANIRGASNALIDAVHDFQCLLLLADDTITEQQAKNAERAIQSTIISDDDYEPITDPADCAA